MTRRSTKTLELTVEEAEKQAAAAVAHFAELEDKLRDGQEVPQQTFLDARNEIDYQQLLVQGARAGEQRRIAAEKRKALEEITAKAPKAIIAKAVPIAEFWAATEAAVDGLFAAIDEYNHDLAGGVSQARRAGAGTTPDDEMASIGDGFSGNVLRWPGGIAGEASPRRFLEAILNEVTSRRRLAENLPVGWNTSDTKHGRELVGRFLETIENNVAQSLETTIDNNKESIE